MIALRAFLAGAWTRAWFANADARPLGLMRIAVGAILTLQLAERLPYVHKGYSSEGYLTKETARLFVSDWQWSLLFLFDAPWVAQTLVVLGLVGAILFALGQWTRVAGSVAFVVVVSLHNRNSIGMYGADMLPRYFLFYLLLMPCGRALSLDAWRERLGTARVAARKAHDPRAARRHPPVFAVWPVRLFQIQVFFIYLLTGINKAYGVDYHEGVTLWYALVNPIVSRFYPWAYSIYIALYPMFKVATIATLWWEIALPWMLPFRRLRVIALAMGVVVHGGIAVLLQIGWWGPLMLVSYLAFLSGRPFERVHLLQIRQRRAQVPRSERATIEYDPNELRAAELVARVVAVDHARLVRVVPRKGPLRLRVGTSELSREDSMRALRKLLRWHGAFVTAPFASR